jgi:DNA-binding NarL/FixJ family response regulator
MKICIIDDHVLMAQSIKRLIEQANEAYDVKMYRSPVDFLADDATKWKPEIIITDLLMPVMDGMEMIAKAKEKLGKEVKFILLTSIQDVQTLQAALRKGINAYLTKDASEEEVLQAIEAVMEGKRFMNRSIQDRLLTHMFQDEDDVVYHLSRQEKEVLKRICDGNTPKEIAFDMQLSINTIQSYIKSLLRKFKLNRTADLIVFAMKNGLYMK